MLRTVMFSLTPGTPGPQAADAAHDQVNLHARLRGAVEGLDDLPFGQRIDLGDDAGGQALAGVLGLALDELEQAVVQLERRDQELAHALELADAGQQVEEVGGVLAELRAAGEQAEVGVELRGGGVVIAGGQVDVAADVVAFAPHDQAALGVDLVADQAVDHMHAGFLQLARPLDVVGLVEARAQFHHGGHLLAVLHRVHRARR